MTAIWAHGQVHPEIEYFYPPDEVKYHGGNRGIISLNFFGSYCTRARRCDDNGNDDDDDDDNDANIGY